MKKLLQNILVCASVVVALEILAHLFGSIEFSYIVPTKENDADNLYFSETLYAMAQFGDSIEGAFRYPHKWIVALCGRSWDSDLTVIAIGWLILPIVYGTLIYRAYRYLYPQPLLTLLAVYLLFTIGIFLLLTCSLLFSVGGALVGHSAPQSPVDCFGTPFDHYMYRAHFSGIAWLSYSVLFIPFSYFLLSKQRPNPAFQRVPSSTRLLW